MIFLSKKFDVSTLEPHDPFGTHSRADDGNKVEQQYHAILFKILVGVVKFLHDLVVFSFFDRNFVFGFAKVVPKASQILEHVMPGWEWYH